MRDRGKTGEREDEATKTFREHQKRETGKLDSSVGERKHEERRKKRGNREEGIKVPGPPRRRRPELKKGYETPGYAGAKGKEIPPTAEKIRLREGEKTPK